jgi:pectate lyase
MKEQLRTRWRRLGRTSGLLQLALLAAACGDPDPLPPIYKDVGPAGRGGSFPVRPDSGRSGSGGTGGSGTDASDGSAGTGGTDAGDDGSHGDAGAGGDAAPPSDAGSMGWASVPALGQNGTYGGIQGETIEVTTIPAFLAAAASPTARVIKVRGHLIGDVVIGSNKTVEGVEGAVIEGYVRIESAQNVIFRNLTVKGKNCTDSPTDCSAGDDAIEVRASHHVWFDHLDVSDGSDGNLDVVHGSDYVTVSFSKFWYSGTSREHRFSNLIGSADNSPVDEGKLRVTWHHNWWAQNADQRMPRTRYGLIHVFNNLYTSANNSYCANAGFQASVLLENNVFEGVNSPHTVAGGNLLSRGNVYEVVSGTRDQTGMAFEPPYMHTVDSTSGLAERIKGEAGPH